MLSRNLEKSLHRALAYANERRHEYATLEHLLLALTEDQDAVAVLRACGVDLGRLRGEVLSYVDNELGNLVAAHGNSLRALVKHLDGISGEEIAELNIPTGMPLVYELDQKLRPLDRHYLGDPEKVKAAMEGVAAQGKRK